MRQDEFRERIATVIADLNAAERADRARLYRFARDLLQLATTDLTAPRDRRGRTQSLLELEAAIRETEQRIADAPAAQHDDDPNTLLLPLGHRPAPWPGPGRVVAMLATRNIRGMMAKDPLGYLWLFLAPILTIAAVLGR